MGAINDIREMIKHRKDHGFVKVAVLAMDTNKFNKLFLEVYPYKSGNADLKNRLEQINALMRDIDFPEISILQ